MYRNKFRRFFAKIWPKKITSRDGCVLLIQISVRAPQLPFLIPLGGCHPKILGVLFFPFFFSTFVVAELRMLPASQAIPVGHLLQTPALPATRRATSICSLEREREREMANPRHLQPPDPGVVEQILQKCVGGCSLLKVGGYCGGYFGGFFRLNSCQR